jgi:peptide/nickel transport system ATP-binding protein
MTATTSTTTAPSELRATNLTVELRGADGWHRVVDGVDLCLRPGETLGVVGESGAGKSVSAMAMARLLPERTSRTTAEGVLLNGVDLLGLSSRRMRAIRGSEIGMIFQEPRRSLDPAFTVGNQVMEAVLAHEDVSKREAWTRAVDMLDRVGIVDPAKRAREYPHAFSGGMCQRVMLAVALVTRPGFLIADEPTTALDVTVQAQVLDLIKDLQEEMGLGVLFITHDLGVIAEISDRVAVMYAGQVVETGATMDVLNHPTHPYTGALLSGIPDVTSAGGTLTAIPGAPPFVGGWPQGCRFHPRCAFAQDACLESVPLLDQSAASKYTRCIRSNELVLEGVMQ